MCIEIHVYWNLNGNQLKIMFYNCRYYLLARVFAAWKIYIKSVKKYDVQVSVLTKPTICQSCQNKISLALSSILYSELIKLNACCIHMENGNGQILKFSTDPFFRYLPFWLLIRSHFCCISFIYTIIMKEILFQIKWRIDGHYESLMQNITFKRN